MGTLVKELFETGGSKNNKLSLEDRAFHDWYRFVLSFPPHLVRQYLDRFSLSDGSIVLDPFCGTGTTLVEAKKNSISSIGVEASPMAAFASHVKTNWVKKHLELREAAETIADRAGQMDLRFGQQTLKFSREQEQIILSDSISEVPLHKCLVLLRLIKTVTDPEV